MAIDLTSLNELLKGLNKLSDAQKLAFNNIIWEEIYKVSNIFDFHERYTGIRCNDPIPLGSKGRGFDFMQSTANLESQCDDIPCDISIKNSTKLWNPARYKCTIEICFKDIECRLKDYLNSEKCNDANLTGTALFNLIKNLIIQYTRESLWVKTWFANTSSPNLVLNGHDGLFVQMLALAPDTNENQRVVITENTNADYASQKLMPGQAAYEYFNAMYDLMLKNINLSSKIGDLKIMTTSELAMNYLQWLRSKNATCCEKDLLKGIYSLNNLSIYDVPIMRIKKWDKIIRNPNLGFNDGTKYDNPHRAVLTYKENIPIGTCEDGALENFMPRYNEYTEKTKFELEYTIDTKVLIDGNFILGI